MKKFAVILISVLLLLAGCAQEKKVEKKNDIAPPVQKETESNVPAPEAPPEVPTKAPAKQDDLLSDDLDRAIADLTLIGDLNLSEET